MLQMYHPTRVFTLVYQPFCIATAAVLTYHEARINTRLRIISGFSILFVASFLLIIVSCLPIPTGGSDFVLACIYNLHLGTPSPAVGSANIWDRRDYKLHDHMLSLWNIWIGRRISSRRDDGRSLVDVSSIHPSTYFYLN